MPAGDFDYERLGAGYAEHRRPDPRIAALIHAALGEAGTVLNVGAGAGAYEPADRQVTAVEPSAAMRAQRPAGAAPAIDAVAAALPFEDGSFDAAMATSTVHQWPDFAAGLREVRRVVRGPVAILTFDGDALPAFWLTDYAPEMIAAEQRRMPPVPAICSALGGACDVSAVPIPFDCTDGFTEAFYGRPEAFLDDAVRRAQSCWALTGAGAEARAVALLADDLHSGAWDRRHGDLRSHPEYLGSPRLIVSRPRA